MIESVKYMLDDMTTLMFHGIGDHPDDAECVKRFKQHIADKGGDYYVWAPATDPYHETSVFGTGELPYLMRLNYDQMVGDAVYHCSLWIKRIEDERLLPE